jgi:predicted nucleic acid-binding protein
MSDRIFVDTNVLVYAYDRSEPQKQQQALRVLDRLAVTGAGVISTQVLSEFFVTVTHKIAAPLSVDEAHDRVKNYLQSWTILDLTGMVVLEAVRGVRDHQFNFWDAQIWAVARLNQLAVVLSEDFNVGAVIEGVRFANPFAEDFQIEEWVD